MEEQVEISEIWQRRGKSVLDDGRISRSKVDGRDGREAITGVWGRFSHKSFLGRDDGAVSYISLRVNSP